MGYCVTRLFFLTNVAIMSKQSGFQMSLLLRHGGVWVISLLSWVTTYNNVEVVTLQRIQSMLAFPGKLLVDYYVIHQTTSNSQESNGWSEKLENLKLSI